MQNTETLVQNFVDRCANTYGDKLNQTEDYHYNSLPICIIDCVYSLRTHYNTVTIPIVKRYADKYLKGNIYSSNDTISNLIYNIENCGGTIMFEEIVNNHQKLGGKANIHKSDICLKLATYLKLIGIETIEDFQTFKSQELLEIVIRSVKGIGEAGTNYLFMLAGDSNRCKPDVHIHHCVKDFCGQDMSADECQTLFQNAVKVLKKDYPTLTVRGLDQIIWRDYQSRRTKRNK